MKNKKKIKKKNVKLNKVLRYILYVILTAIVLEFIYVSYKSIKESINTEAREFNQSIKEIDNGYIIAGSSNFKYSKYNKKTRKYEKARLAIYNDKDEITNEFQYKKGYNSMFMDVVVDDDNYIAVGCYQKTSSEKNNEQTEGLIVKYDNKGNIVWDINYTKLDDTKFNRILVVDDGYIIAGSTNSDSDDEDTKGGAIIIKYDKKGNKKWETFYGDISSASFNDIIKIDDGYITVGSKDASTGVIAKYDNNGTFKWKKEVNYIGKNGIRKVEKYKNNLILISSFKKSNYVENRTNTAIVAISDLKGNIKKVVEYGEEKEIAQFNGLVVDNNYIYVSGGIAYQNSKKTTKDKTYYYNKGIYVKYDMNLKLIDKKEIDKKATYQYTNLNIINNKLYSVGYTNAKMNLDHADGTNYVSIIDKYDK